MARFLLRVWFWFWSDSAAFIVIETAKGQKEGREGRRNMRD